MRKLGQEKTPDKKSLGSIQIGNLTIWLSWRWPNFYLKNYFCRSLQMIYALICCLLIVPESTRAEKAAENCNNDINVATLEKIPYLSSSEFDIYSRQVARCYLARQHSDHDYLLDSILKSIEELETKSTQNENAEVYGTRLLNLLKICADEGHPSCMHNYAALHNVDPRGSLIDYFPEKPLVFADWTYKAAHAGDPRSLFNLIVRIASDPAPPGFVYDEEQAGQLSVKLRQMISSDYSQLDWMLPFLGLRHPEATLDD